MDQGPYRYSVVPGEESNVDHHEEKDHGGRQKILRSIGRRVRSMSSIPFCGRSGTLYWIISSTWLIFFFTRCMEVVALLFGIIPGVQSMRLWTSQHDRLH